MSGYTEHMSGLERGDIIPLDELRRERSPETVGPSSTGNSSERSLATESRKLRGDFDDGANALWSLYVQEAKTHDEAEFLSLAANMDGVPTFAGLFSAVITSFLVLSIQNLQANPADESVYYQNQSVYYQQQSVAILAQMSQQIASIAQQVAVTSTGISPQVLTPSTAPHTSVSSTSQQVSVQSTQLPPYPAFRPSGTDIRVNIYWLIGLVISLSAAQLAMLVQQWVPLYMQVFQRYDHPLKRARFRQFFFDGAKGMRTSANAVRELIRLSFIFFLFGLGDFMMKINTTVGWITLVSNSISGLFYLYRVWEHLWNPRSPFQTLISRPIILSIRKFFSFGDRLPPKRNTPTTFETYREELVMEETEDRKARDVRAIRWLVNNSAVTGEMEPLVLAIPGSFNTEWGRDVWMDVSESSLGLAGPDILGHLSSGQAPLTHRSPRLPEGTAVDTICRGVRNLFDTCSNRHNLPNEEARRRRLRACVEAAASLVCCIDYRLDWFGEVGRLVGEIGHIENISQTLTTASDPSFIVRWTCLSLVSIRQLLFKNRLQLAEYAVSGLARFQSAYGQPDEAGRRSAERIDQCLKTAWERVEDLHQAFEPWAQKRTRVQVEEILRNHKRQISELERIKVETDDMEDIDWRISLVQDAMDDATYRLTRQLPGVSFDKLRRSESFLINDIFNTPDTSNTPVTPQLIFLGQQAQALTGLGLKLREVLDGQLTSGYEEVLENLKAVDQVPISLRRADGLMRRQLWRLQDIRDGGCLGFSVELFFLSLRQLLSTPSLRDSNSVFFIGTFKAITSHWMESKESLGTQHILLNITLDLIIRDRGVLSNFSYPEPITAMLFDMVSNMLQGYGGPDECIRDALLEIESVDPRSCMDAYLRNRALRIFDVADSVNERHELSLTANSTTSISQKSIYVE